MNAEEERTAAAIRCVSWRCAAMPSSGTRSGTDSAESLSPVCTVVGKSKWYHQVFQASFHLKRYTVPLNLTWVDLAFSCTKGYPGQVYRHSLPFQVEAALKYLVVPLTFAHDCTRAVLSQTPDGACVDTSGQIWTAAHSCNGLR